jgi:predicted CoA-substrate-specific enzyme activase
MPFFMGIDIGSSRSKGMLLHDREPASSVECPSGGDFGITGVKVHSDLLARAGLDPDDVFHIIATGYGAKAVTFASETRSDLSCHAAGIHTLFPSVRTVIDVGDLNSKVFKVDDNGLVHNFLLSGKCAGGSGRVLQIIAKVLQVQVEEIGELSLKSERRIDFNTGCVVFAESEAISRLAEGISKEDLLAGIHRALASQLNGLAERLGIEKPLALVGGGARNVGLVKALEEITGLELFVPNVPHMTAAYGAALLAQQGYNPRESFRSKKDLT